MQSQIVANRQYIRPFTQLQQTPHWRVDISRRWQRPASRAMSRQRLAKPEATGQRFAKYRVTSKPRRRSVKAGLVHMACSSFRWMTAAFSQQLSMKTTSDTASATKATGVMSRSGIHPEVGMIFVCGLAGGLRASKSALEPFYETFHATSCGVSTQWREVSANGHRRNIRFCLWD